jgi:heme-degrading monooxygenase HmoA
MASLVEMNERVSIFSQMNKEENVKGSVILINKFSVAPREIDEFLKGWATEAEKFKLQPGYISTQLHRGIGESGTFINYAVWESVAHFSSLSQQFWH